MTTTTTTTTITRVTSGSDDVFSGDSELVSKLPYTPLIQRAYATAVFAHHGQMRQGGGCYLNHPLRVALKVRALGEETIIAALLHDVLEDSTITAANLREFGFSEAVVSAVISVTKREGEPYEDAIARAAADVIGRRVKLADNYDNSSASELACYSSEKKAKKLRKYLPARVALCQAIPTHEQALIAR